MDNTKKFVDIQNLKLYNSLVNNDIKKKIQDSLQDYLTEDEIKALLPDTWDFWVSYYPEATVPYVRFSNIEKNGETFTGNLSGYVIKIVGGVSDNMMAVMTNQAVTDGVISVNLSAAQQAYLADADTLIFKIGTPDGVSMLASYVLPLGDAQIYDYVRELETAVTQLQSRVQELENQMIVENETSDGANDFSEVEPENSSDSVVTDYE